MKVHLLDKGQTWVQKRKGFTEDPKEEISGNQGFRAREASYPCYYALRGKDSFWLISWKMWCRSPKAMFG